MITFHLAAHSNLPPYVQIVEQVRQALLNGVLRPGDRLPTVKEVVGSARDQPEHGAQGLSRPRTPGPGRGPARRRDVRDAPPGRAAAERAGRAPSALLTTWVARASALAGLADADIESMVRAVLAGEHQRGDRMTTAPTGAAIVAEGLGKRYGSKWALRDCTFAVPAGPGGAAWSAANGAGKTTLLRLLAGLSRPTAGRAEVRSGAAGQRRVPRRDRLPGAGRLRCTAVERRGPPADGRAPEPGAGTTRRLGTRLTRCGSRSIRRSGRCPAASALRWLSRSRSPSGRGC